MSQLIVEVPCLKALLGHFGITAVNLSTDGLHLADPERKLSIHIQPPQLKGSVRLDELTFVLESVEFKLEGIELNFSLK